MHAPRWAVRSRRTGSPIVLGGGGAHIVRPDYVHDDAGL